MICPHCQKELPSKSNSGYRGVWRNKYGTFRAHIQQEYIQSFKNAEDAARAYDVEAKKRYGADAILNFPESP